MRLGGCILVAAALISAVAEADNNDQARKHFVNLKLEEAKALIDRGEFRPAIAILEATYAATKSPTVLFNLGGVHDYIGRTTGNEKERRIALDYFRRFVEAAPNAPERSEAERIIGELVLALKLDTKPPEEAAKTTPPPLEPVKTTPPQELPKTVPPDETAMTAPPPGTPEKPTTPQEPPKPTRAETAKRKSPRIPALMPARPPATPPPDGSREREPAPENPSLKLPVEDPDAAYQRGRRDGEQQAEQRITATVGQWSFNRKMGLGFTGAAVPLLAVAGVLFTEMGRAAGELKEVDPGKNQDRFFELNDRKEVLLGVGTACLTLGVSALAVGILYLALPARLRNIFLLPASGGVQVGATF